MLDYETWDSMPDYVQIHGENWVYIAVFPNNLEGKQLKILKLILI